MINGFRGFSFLNLKMEYNALALSICQKTPKAEALGLHFLEKTERGLAYENAN